MKSVFKLLLPVTCTLALASCGEDPVSVNIQKQLKASEAHVSEVLNLTVAGNGDAISAEFSEDFPKTAFLQSIEAIETRVGKLNSVDLLYARWNPAEFSGEDDVMEPGDSIRVIAVMLSGEQSGATLDIKLQPGSNGLVITGMDCELAGETTPASESISYTE